MYGSGDIRNNGQNFSSFWAIFCPLTGFELTKKKVYYSFITQEEQAKACRMHKNFGVFAMQNKVFERRFWQHIKSVLC